MDYQVTRIKKGYAVFKAETDSEASSIAEKLDDAEFKWESDSNEIEEGVDFE